MRFEEVQFISLHCDKSGSEVSRGAKVPSALRLSYSKVARRQNHHCGLPLTVGGLPHAAWRRRLVGAVVPTRWYSAQGALETHWYRAFYKSTARNDALPCKRILMQKRTTHGFGESIGVLGIPRRLTSSKEAMNDQTEVQLGWLATDRRWLPKRHLAAKNPGCRGPNSLPPSTPRIGRALA